MAYYCPGCHADVSSWPNNHYVAGSATWGSDGVDAACDYVWCFSCWSGFEDLMMNTNLDKAAGWMCSAMCGAGRNTWRSPLNSIINFVTGISSYIVTYDCPYVDDDYDS